MRKSTKLLFKSFLVICTLVLIPTLLIYAGGSKDLETQLDQCNANAQSLESKNSQLESENQNLKSQIESLKTQKADLENRISDLEEKIKEKERELLAIEKEPEEPMIVTKTIEEQIQEKEQHISELQQEKESLETDLSEINAQIIELQNENMMLRNEVKTVTAERETLNNKVKIVSVENEMLKNEIDTIKTEREEAEKALSEYEKIQEESLKMMDVALESIYATLKEEIETGKLRVFKGTLGIILDITGEHMFDEGSIEINADGRIILKKLAKLLEDLEGYIVGVIGNADSKPIITPSLKERFPTNWELSSRRGCVVVRYLLNSAHISPSGIVSMGLGEFQPIDDNDTEEGRGNNRRVNIVLLPIDVLSAVVVGAEIR